MYYLYICLLVSNLIAFWLETILCIISVLLKLLRFASWLSIWTVLENVPCALKNVYPLIAGWGVL